MKIVLILATCSALFHVKTRVSLKYFVTVCRQIAYDRCQNTTLHPTGYIKTKYPAQLVLLVHRTIRL